MNKPGYQTTEFWTMVATVVWVTVFSHVSPETQAYVIGAVASVYKFTRGMTKSGK